MHNVLLNKTHEADYFHGLACQHDDFHHLMQLNPAKPQSFVYLLCSLVSGFLFFWAGCFVPNAPGG